MSMIRVFTIYRKHLEMMSVKLLSVLVLFSMQVVVANLVTPAIYGTFGVFLTCITLGSIFCILGSERLLLKNAATDAYGVDGMASREIIDTAIFVCLLISIIISPLIFIYISKLSSSSLSIKLIVLIFSSLFLFGLIRIFTAVIKGLDRIVWAELVFFVYRPLIFLFFVILIYFFNDEMVSLRALITATAISLLATILFCLRNSFLQKYYDFKQIKIRVGSLVNFYRNVIPFLVVAMGFPLLTNTDLLFIGLVLSADQVAIYLASVKIVSVVLMVLVSSNVIISRNIAKKYGEQDIEGLSIVVQRSNLFVVSLSIFPLLIVVVFGKELLGFFGQHYRQGYDVLVVLLIGQVFNVLCGPVNLICTLTALQKEAARLVIFAILLEIALCMLFVVLLDWGLKGAAISNAITYAFVNVSLLVLIYRKIGINVSLFGVMSLFNSKTRGNAEKDS